MLKVRFQQLVFAFEELHLENWEKSLKKGVCVCTCFNKLNKEA